MEVKYNTHVEFLQDDKEDQRDKRWPYFEDIKSLAELPLVGDYLGYAEARGEGIVEKASYTGRVVSRTIWYLSGAQRNFCEITLVIDTSDTRPRPSLDSIEDRS